MPTTYAAVASGFCTVFATGNGNFGSRTRECKCIKDFFTNQCLPFIGLPDPEHKVLKLYGQEINIFKLGRMPAQAIIDKNGFVRYIHYGHSMSDIPENKDLLTALKEINTESVKFQLLSKG